MFSSAVQSGIVSLFSSTGSDPLGLFSLQTDDRLPSDSFICLLKDSDSIPRPPPPAILVPPSAEQETLTDESGSPNYTLGQTVLHIQSPTLRTTFVRSPPSGWTGPNANRGGHRARRNDLGMEHSWVHLQVRNLGKEWSFEVGLVDQSGREGIVRCSTFQKQPRLKLTSPPLLHLPLSFPPASSRPLTSWCTLALNLPSLLPHFSSFVLIHTDEDEEKQDAKDGNPLAMSTHSPSTAIARVPSGIYSHVSYVKVYATCRLRRIWFSEDGNTQRLPWEFELYGAG
ncbi:hypothetical protein B0H21DRAFT_378705 [Amylocystis lapponica]|nr:hypothetical protein B0H21DRAFT_378705 [Amylocystis lapponica]